MPRNSGRNTRIHGEGGRDEAKRACGSRPLNAPGLLERLRESVLDLFFPLKCAGCGEEGNLICPACRRGLPAREEPFCQRCGDVVDGGNYCRSCAAHSLTIDGIRSPFIFKGTVRKAVHQLKYRHLKTMSAPLGRLLGEFIQSSPVYYEIVVPVPLHPRRLRQRGYNQAALLAKEAAKVTGLPVMEDLLRRVKDTAAQARSVSAAERRRNVRNAFECSRQLDGDSILLIDDVCTTGATLDSCALVLKKAGAGPVWGLTVARDSLSS